MTEKLPRHIHGEITATQALGGRALDYAHQIVVAEDSGAPVGSPAVTSVLTDLKYAAIGYTLMMILSEDLLPVEEIQRIDDALIARLNEDTDETATDETATDETATDETAEAETPQPPAGEPPQPAGMIEAVHLRTLFASAAEVFVTEATRTKYPHWDDVIDAPATTTPPPTTRGEATPHVMLCGPFKGAPDLVGVALFVGIGLIEVRDDAPGLCAYKTVVIDGDGMATRVAFLTTARDLFFHDVTFQPKIDA